MIKVIGHGNPWLGFWRCCTIIARGAIASPNPQNPGVPSGSQESINLENGGEGDHSANAAHRGQREKDQNLGQRPLRTQTLSEQFGQARFGSLATQVRRRDPAGWRKSRGVSCSPAEEATPALGVYRGRCQAGSNLGWVWPLQSRYGQNRVYSLRRNSCECSIVNRRKLSISISMPLILSR